MFKKLFDLRWEIAAGIVLVLLLGLVRNFEKQLFYDPFLEFFKGDYHQNLPEYEGWRLYGNYLLRYAINMLLSVTLLFVVFKKVEIVKIAAFLYLFFFAVLVVGLYCSLNFQDNMMVVFYIRRFIIQPIFLLLFIPGFYYQEFMIKK